MDSLLYHFFFLTLVFPISSFAQTNGTIPVGTSLTATQNSTPWLSPSSDFAFGFQFLQQNGQFLLSIWYHNLPERTIVWYANEGNLVPSGSKLELTEQNGLVLTDPQGTQLWSSNPSSTTIDHGFINDTGNFVLVGTSSSSLWESFKNPTDTLLPTQTMERGGVLNSRLSDTNFSPGRFQFRLLKNGKAVLNRRDVDSNFAYEAYYNCSDTYDGSNPSNSGRQLVFNETGHMFIIRENGKISEIMTQLLTPSADYYYRATLNFDGVFTVYSGPKKPDGDQSWTAIWSNPNNICMNIFARACGYNSICKLDPNRRPVCECPKGYSLLDPNDTYGSCKPSFVQSCNENKTNLGEDLYDFDELSNTTWPFNDYERKNPFSEKDCRNSCLTDCFCAVAIYNDDSCWKKKLPLSSGRRDFSFSGKAFFKVRKDDPREGPDCHRRSPDSPNQISGPRTKQGTFTLVVSMLLGSSVFVNFVLGFFSFSHVYKKKVAKPIVGNYNIVETNLRGFSYEELVEAANGFTDELGRGAFGIVYKGVIDMGRSRCIVAIKKLDKVVRDGEREFRAEVNAIAHTHHKNLVRLLGFCDDGENHLLVYEYMNNGTLASFLFGDTKPSWNQRSRIALGIAKGLSYLHEECTTQIIHCDIKPQNILLDDYYNAIISDFGLAKLLMMDQSQTHTAIRGTKGYVAPEWFRNTAVTVKVDVYSFGVLLLEIVSCRRNVESLNIGGGEGVILTDWIWDCFQEGKLETLVENDVKALNNMTILERFVMVGIWCIQEDPVLRPSMRKVSQMLEGVIEVTLPPCPYPFSSITMGSET